MCLAIPAKIVEMINEEFALVSSGGVKKEVSISLIEEPKVGDYVIVHVGYALNKVDQQEAFKTIELMEELGLDSAL